MPQPVWAFIEAVVVPFGQLLGFQARYAVYSTA
jgi:hypothetical protein